MSVDWQTALTPLIVALVPAILSQGKKLLGHRTWLVPIIAPVLAAGLDFVSLLTTQTHVGTGTAALLGLAGVGLREILDQLRSPTTVGKGPLMKMLVLALAVAALTAGCAHSLGYAGRNPGYIKCAGKGAITGTGSVAAGAGIAGTEMNSFSITADCGPGFEFSQGQPPPSTPGKP